MDEETGQKTLDELGKEFDAMVVIGRNVDEKQMEFRHYPDMENPHQRLVECIGSAISNAADHAGVHPAAVAYEATRFALDYIGGSVGGVEVIRDE